MTKYEKEMRMPLFNLTHTHTTTESCHAMNDMTSERRSCTLDDNYDYDYGIVKVCVCVYICVCVCVCVLCARMNRFRLTNVSDL